MLPSWIQQKGWIVQVADPDKKPKEPPKRTLLNAFDVVKRMNYTDRSMIDSARGVGFPPPVQFEIRKSGGHDALIPLYDLDKIEQWRDRMRELANLK